MATILAVETSCDETAAAVVADGRYVLSNVVLSQVEMHQKYGGVVPEIASRQHMLGILPVVSEAMLQADVTWQDLSAVAVTHGPGLAGSLLVGVNLAKGIAFAHGLPLIGVNHIEGHIYAAWLVKSRRALDDQEPAPPEFPLLALVVSGGHTELLLMQDHGQYRLIGRTRDDAAGEAFDKVARILGLPYPGGPSVQYAADQLQRFGLRARRGMVQLPRAWMRGTYDFSFSGLKTAVLRFMEGRTRDRGFIDPPPMPVSRLTSLEIPLYIAQVASSFQDSVVEVLVTKTIEAAQEFGVKQIIVAGGVAANRLLRSEMQARAPVPVLVPDFSFCTDNAAMIGACAYYRLQRGRISSMDLDVDPNLRLTDEPVAPAQKS